MIMADDETIVGTVGTCCDIWQKYMFGSPWFRFKNRCTGEESNWDSESSDAIDAANRFGNCSPAARVYFILTNSVTQEQLGGIRVCIGLMCHDTEATGETYLGQYAYGSYELTAAATGYENLVETITLDQTEYHLTRELVPTGEIEPGTGCDNVPDWIKPFCVLFSGFITTAIATFTDTIIAPIQKFQDDAWKVTVDMYNVLERVVADAVSEAALWRASLDGVKLEVQSWISASLAGLYAEIENNLIDPLTSSVAALWSDIGNLWSSIEEVIATAEQEVTARVTAITELDKSLRSWIETSIIDIVITGLNVQLKKEEK